MSKRNKPSRFSNKPDLADAHQTDVENKTTPPGMPVVVEEIDDDEEVSYFAKTREYFAGCCGKIAAYSTSAASKTWGGCCAAAQWTWGGICKIPSYCVIRWDSEEDEEETESPDTPPKKGEAVKVNAPPAKIAPTKIDPAKIDHDEDEDELASSRWWGIGIKTAAAAAAVLILAGGYFVAKPLLFDRQTEVAGIVETDDEEGGETGTSEPFAPSISELPPMSELPPVVAPPEPSILAQAPQPVTTPTAAPQGAPAIPQQDFFSQSSQSPVSEPFSAPVIPFPVAGTAPSAVTDPFGTSIAAEPVAPAQTVAAQTTMAQTMPTQTMPTLQPLVPLEPTQLAAAPPQLQPLAPVVAAPFSPAIIDGPSAAPAIPNAIVASEHNAGHNNPASRPTPPAVNTLPQTATQPTFAIIEQMREVVPAIPASGTIQHVPPPVIPPPPEVTPVFAMHPNETAPAIPRDAPVNTAPPVVVVPPAPAIAAESRFIPADSLPLDWQLMERVWELKNESEAAPSNLRFDNAAATSEPALRFTPVSLAEEARNQFADLMPTDVPQPNFVDIERFLPVLENAPQPVIATPRPAYREVSTQTSQPTGEGGTTFQRRIDSEITRSPSAMETYIVQQGDTYMTISDRFYGTSLLYTALARHNQRHGIGWHPAAGAVIEIPTAEFLRLHYADHQERRLDTQRETVRYIVQEGDTIFRLATDRLRDSTRWREIYAINADRIQSVHDLQVGMEILLPVESARMN